MQLKHARLATVLFLSVVALGLADTPPAHLPATTSPSALPDLVTVTYDIYDLIEYPAVGTDRQSDAQAWAMRVDEVKKYITDLVDPNSWKDNGGDVGSISSSPLVAELRITQTPEAQTQIQAGLEKLRQSMRSHTATVAIDAYWVRLLPSQMPSGQSELQASVLADPAVVWAHARSIGFQGESVSTSFKRSANIVSGLTPIVTGASVVFDPQLSSKEYAIELTESAGHIDDGSIEVAFDSSVSMPEHKSEMGQTAERPSTMPSQNWPITVNAENEVAGSTVVEMKAHSTVRLKLGVPTIVSGISDHPGSSDNRTLCLVLCATVTSAK